VAPRCSLERLREDVVGDGGGNSCGDVRGEREGGNPSAPITGGSQDPICTATRRRRRLSSGCTKRRAQRLLASRADR
jgi:hypothetical protein